MPTINTEPGVREEIVNTIAGIFTGRVHNRERTGLASYRYPDGTAGQPVQAATVENGDPNGSNAEEREQLDNCSYKAIRKYTIRLYWRIDDAGDSTSEFRGIVASVMNALGPRRKLGGWAVTTGLPQLVTFSSAIIETESCHYAEIVLTTLSVESVDTWE